MLDWITHLQQRFGYTAKVFVCLEKSRSALIYLCMGYECFEPYPINPWQLAHHRRAFTPAAPKPIKGFQRVEANRIWRGQKGFGV